MASRRDQLRAELELLDLEDEFVAAKEAGTATQEMKLALREKRRQVRESRAGEVVVSPMTITATATVEEV
jgi:hypothetical protein